MLKVLFGSCITPHIFNVQNNKKILKIATSFRGSIMFHCYNVPPKNSKTKYIFWNKKSEYGENILKYFKIWDMIELKWKKSNQTRND